jgi:hypothetical protein
MIDTMRTPQIPAMPGLCNPRSVDEKVIAERKWQTPTKAPAEQKPCDVGLFSDDSKQEELF